MSPEKLVVPDFNSYSFRPKLTSAELINGGVEVRWEDGLNGKLPSVWLREYSPDATTFHSSTREQIVTLTDQAKDLYAGEASISADGYLCVQWLPEKLESRYHPGWLRANLPENAEQPYKLPERSLWAKNRTSEESWLDGKLLYKGDQSVFQEWVESIHIQGLGLLKGLPAKAEVVPLVPEMIGPVRISNFGKVFEVINRSDANTNAYTALPLAAHTDLATREYVPGLQFLFCLINDAAGGDSNLADGFAIAEQLKQESEEFYEVLSTVAVPFGTKDNDSDYQFTAPVLELDRFGALSTIRHTYWLRLPMQGSFDTINSFYAAYRRFQEIANDPSNQLCFRLHPGEMIAFDNRRILHGRTAFDPLSGHRLLRGCYGEREELESCLRMMGRARRKAAFTIEGKHEQ